MALHDAAMTRLSQWGKRAVRAGYAYAEGVHLHGQPPERYRVWESRRAWLWGALLPSACAVVSLIFWPYGLVAWLIFPAQMLRQTIRNPGPIRERVLLAFFQLIARFPETWGQTKFLWNRFRRATPKLIEYK
jgi:hypothetical protein